MNDLDEVVEAENSEESTSAQQETINKMPNPGMDAIMNINVTLSIEVGKTRMKLKDLLNMNQGTVIELNKMAGEPLDILVNDVLIAQGEVVVVNDKYGIRLTDVSSESERLRSSN